MAMTRHKTKEPRLTRKEFFYDVVEKTRLALPDELKGFQTSATMNLTKLYYGNYRLHYEVWTDARDNQIEVGLHFEAGEESTDRLIAYFDRYIVEIKHELGVETELERWTRTWGHLYQLMPYQPLTASLAAAIAGRLSRMIAVAQPILEEIEPKAGHALTDSAGSQPSLTLSTGGGDRSRWRHRARPGGSGRD